MGAPTYISAYDDGVDDDVDDDDDDDDDVDDDHDLVWSRHSACKQQHLTTSYGIADEALAFSNT